MKMFDVYPVYPIEVTHGKQCWIWDNKGNRYLDFYGGHAVISIGHAHPHFTKSIAAQLDKLPFYSNSIINNLQQKLADLLGELSGLENHRLFLVNSGAEANENALKLASFHNGRSKVVSFTSGFHGRTSAAAHVTDSKTIAAPINQGFENDQFHFGDRESVRKALGKGDVSSVIIEGIQGVGGIHCADAEFLGFLRSECTATGTILILDEIQSGYGRSGHFFSFQKNEQLQPDIVSMAKGMGNGFPIGGILIAPHFESKYGLLGTTFGGNHLACAAGIAVLEVIAKENLIENAAVIGGRIKNALEQALPEFEVRGEGLMIGLECDKPVADLRKQLLFEEHLFVGSSSNKNVLRLLPPLNIGEQEADECISKLIKVLRN